MKRVMGIDQSFTSTGIVILENDVIIFHTRLISDSSKDIFDRAFELSRMIADIALTWEVDKVNIEGLGFAARGDQTRNLAGLQFSIIKSLREATSVEIDIVAPTSLKKFATGKGNADKVMMFESLPAPAKAIIEEFKKTKGRYDMADAFWLASYPQILPLAS